jgi:hypothetical protein
MEIGKYIAALLASLMAVSTYVGAALAANNLSGFPGFLYTVTATASSPAYLVVVGANAKTSDVVGAIDLASRLAEGSFTIETVAAAPTAAVEGIEKTLQIPTTAGGNAIVGADFPGTLTTFHYKGLQQGEFTYKGEKYSFHEEVVLSDSPTKLALTHKLADPVNGTIKMRLDSEAVEYRFVFDENIPASQFNTSVSPNYDYPVKVSILGKEFLIVREKANAFDALVGAVGTITDKVAVTYSGYSVYSDLGADNSWARIVVKDSAGNTVATATVDQGLSKDFSEIGITVKVIKVRALSDGTIVGVDVVVGPIGKVEKTYDGSDTATFPDADNWVMAANFDGDGVIEKGEYITVTYKPATLEEKDKYYAAGVAFKGPNNYFELGYNGLSVDKFTKITISPVTGKTWYESTATDAKKVTGLNGLEISADVSGSINYGQNSYNKVYVLFNQTAISDSNITQFVFLGYWDDVATRIVKIPTVDPLKAVWNATDYISQAKEFEFKLTYGVIGTANFYLKFKVPEAADDLIGVKVNSTAEEITLAYTNKTALADATTPEVKLGAKDAEAESDEVRGKVEGSLADIGLQEGNILTDGGLLVYSVKTNAAGNKAVIGVPAETVKAKVYFGKLGAVAPGEVTYNKVSPIKTAVAKLDSEVTAADKAAYHLVLVGGPCVNSLVADLKAAGKFDYGCADWPGENFAYFQVIDDAFTSGKVAVVLAGTRAEDTRLACSVAQNYDAYKTQFGNATKVKITGTIAAPSITPA